MPAREERDQDFANDAMLAHDRFPKLFFEPPGGLRDALQHDASLPTIPDH